LPVIRPQSAASADGASKGSVVVTPDRLVEEVASAATPSRAGMWPRLTCFRSYKRHNENSTGGSSSNSWNAQSARLKTQTLPRSV
jgi:hypothetical protein